MAIITIGGVALPDDNLTDYTLKQSDMDSANTGRGEDGYMIRDRIRSNVYSLQASFEMLTDVQVATILTATNPAEFDVTINDNGTPVTKTMMRSGDIDKSMRCVGYWDINLSLTEY